MTAAESWKQLWLCVVRLSPAKWSIPPRMASGCRCQKCISISEFLPSGLAGFHATVSTSFHQIPFPRDRPNIRTRKMTARFLSFSLLCGCAAVWQFVARLRGVPLSVTESDVTVCLTSEVGLAMLHATVLWWAHQGCWHQEIGQMSEFRLPRL